MIKFPVAYFTEGGRLGKSPDMVNPLLSLPGVYSFQECLRGRRGLFNEAKDCDIISQVPEVGDHDQPRIKIKSKLPARE